MFVKGGFGSSDVDGYVFRFTQSSGVQYVQFYYRISSSNTLAFTAVATGADSNVWTHVSLVRAGGTHYMYIDGIQIATGTGGGSSDAGSTQVMRIGSPYDGAVNKFFEGYLDDAIISLGKLDRSTSVSITLFDLIPLVNPEQFLSADPSYSSFYNSKLESIGQAKLLLTISKFTKQEALDKLKIQNDRVINISTGINHDLFKEEDTDNSQEVLSRLGIKKHYIFTS